MSYVINFYELGQSCYFYTRNNCNYTPYSKGKLNLLKRILE